MQQREGGREGGRGDTVSKSRRRRRGVPPRVKNVWKGERDGGTQGEEQGGGRGGEERLNG